MKFRNICTIAHVDHGKTTLVDGLFRQSGTFASHKEVAERVMDSGDLEKERGITIAAKNASFYLDDTKVNIVDTPGHADFGGEVERIMNMVDGAILLVDAAEGPLPQTRFVLQNAIAKGLKIIVCINKVDRQEVQGSGLIDRTVDKLFDLFIELGASDDQCDFPVVYACAREGWCTQDKEQVPQLVSKETTGDLSPLFKLILDLPEPDLNLSRQEPFMMVSHINYSEFVGSCALGKLEGARLNKNDTIYRHGVDDKGQPKKEKFVVTAMFAFKGMEQVGVESLEPGDIGIIAGNDSFAIGDSLASEKATPGERINVESPTMRMIFSVNTSPFSGKEGKPLQSRELRERLLNETRANPALKLEDGDTKDQFFVYGRGELQFGILIETMRREGFEFMVGKPGVIYIEDGNGQLTEPYENLVLDLPEAYSGDVTRLFQERKGHLSSYENQPGLTTEPRIRLSFEIPTRGILGTKSIYLTATRGAGLMSSEYLEHRTYAGEMRNRTNGSLIADREGNTTAYSLNTIQQRGVLFVGEGTKVYEGMIIGENSRDDDLNVNAIRPKKLTNVRSSGSDGLTILQGTRKMSLEACLEWINDDEWIEVTPQNIRLRKKVLQANMRPVRKKDRP